MARLNDVPAGAESLEALKRRFVRQNREFARANSAQSQRIHSLEAEVARLLAENMALREQNTSLQAETERLEADVKSMTADPSSRSTANLENAVQGFKETFAGKLRELSELVDGLGRPMTVTKRHAENAAYSGDTEAATPDIGAEEGSAGDTTAEGPAMRNTQVEGSADAVLARDEKRDDHEAGLAVQPPATTNESSSAPIPTAQDESEEVFQFTRRGKGGQSKTTTARPVRPRVSNGKKRTALKPKLVPGF
ncbi:hypothetical protein KEM52_005573 [Ascosphaera acerosa]|nr:hypothetical protein KEM52_005573 [Ascosphaera acerosa]